MTGVQTCALPIFPCNGSDSSLNPFEEGGNDRGENSSSNDPLHGIRSPMTMSKTKRMKQALQGLILKIKEKEDQCELRATPNWVTFIRIDEDVWSLT